MFDLKKSRFFSNSIKNVFKLLIKQNLEVSISGGLKENTSKGLAIPTKTQPKQSLQQSSREALKNENVEKYDTIFTRS